MRKKNQSEAELCFVLGEEDEIERLLATEERVDGNALLTNILSSQIKFGG